MVADAPTDVVLDTRLVECIHLVSNRRIVALAGVVDVAVKIVTLNVVNAKPDGTGAGTDDSLVLGAVGADVQRLEDERVRRLNVLGRLKIAIERVPYR